MLDTKQVDKDLRKGERQRSHFLQVQIVMHTVYTMKLPQSLHARHQASG